MKIALSDSRQSWISRLLVAVAIVTSAVLCLAPAVTAGQPDNSPRPPFGSSTPPRETVAPVSTTAGVSKIRVGKHPDFTRVVLELTGSYEWTIEQQPGAPVRILIPGAGVDASIRRLEFSTGVIRSVQTTRRANGVEVIVVCEPTGVKLRTQTLTEPERLVVDVSLPGAGEGGGRWRRPAHRRREARPRFRPRPRRRAPGCRILRLPRLPLVNRRIERRVSPHPWEARGRRRRGEAEPAHRWRESGRIPESC